MLYLRGKFFYILDESRLLWNLVHMHTKGTQQNPRGVGKLPYKKEGGACTYTVFSSTPYSLITVDFLRLNILRVTKTLLLKKRVLVPLRKFSLKRSTVIRL